MHRKDPIIFSIKRRTWDTNLTQIVFLSSNA